MYFRRLQAGIAHSYEYIAAIWAVFVVAVTTRPVPVIETAATVVVVVCALAMLTHRYDCRCSKWSYTTPPPRGCNSRRRQEIPAPQQ